MTPAQEHLMVPIHLLPFEPPEEGVMYIIRKDLTLLH